MPSIQLHILDGPAANRRQMFDQDTVRFGRDADNDVILTLETASRRHGELTFTEGRWRVSNLSANGTQLNGRAVKKPRPVSEGDTISIGKKPIARVHSITASDGDVKALEATGPEAEDDDQAVTSGKTTGMDRKTKLAPAIFIVSAVLSLIIIVVGQAFDGDSTTNEAPPPFLSAADIQVDVRRPIDVQYPDAGESSRYLQRAQEYYNQLDVRSENVYYAWESYQLALSHSAKDRFDSGLDQRQFLFVQDRLARDIERAYTHATDLIRAGDHAQAARELHALLTRIYPRRDGPVVQNINSQRAYATSKIRK